MFKVVGNRNITALAGGDFDGDGDINLSAGVEGERLYLLENKIPQKNKLEE